MNKWFRNSLEHLRKLIGSPRTPPTHDYDASSWLNELCGLDRDRRGGAILIRRLILRRWRWWWIRPPSHGSWNSWVIRKTLGLLIPCKFTCPHNFFGWQFSYVSRYFGPRIVRINFSNLQLFPVNWLTFRAWIRRGWHSKVLVVVQCGRCGHHAVTLSRIWRRLGLCHFWRLI